MMHRQRHAEPDDAGRFLLQKDPGDRNDDNVECGDEACLSGGGGLQALLLEIRGHRQCHAATDASQDQVPPGTGPGLSGGIKISPAHLAKHYAQDQQKDERYS